MLHSRLFLALLLLAGLLGWTSHAQAAQQNSQRPGSQYRFDQRQADDEEPAQPECFLVEDGCSAEFPFLKKSEGEELIRLGGKTGVYLSCSAGGNWYCRRARALSHSLASLLSTPSLQALETRLQI